VTYEDTIHAAYDAWSRREVEDLLVFTHPDAEARPVLGANVGTDVYRGHEGLRRWFRDLHQEWDEFETRVGELEEHGDLVLCTIQIHARGRASGVVIDAELYHVIEMREGLIARLLAFRDRESAVQALGAT
jgi:ketosteroid isomerase-like protein